MGYLAAVFACRLVAEELRELLAQLVDVGVEHVVFEAVGAGVHEDAVARHRAGQLASVGGEDVAPVGLDRDALVGAGLELLAIAATVDKLELEGLADGRQHDYRHRERYQLVAQKHRLAQVAYHTLLSSSRRGGSVSSFRSRPSASTRRSTSLCLLMFISSADVVIDS